MRWKKMGSYLMNCCEVVDEIKQQDDEGKNKAVNITEEEEIADDKEISEIA